MCTRSSSPADLNPSPRKPTGVSRAAAISYWASAGPFVLALALVGVAIVITHWATLDSKAFNVDDNEYLLSNPLVSHPSWHNACRFLTEVLTPSSVPGYYQPLTMISLMLDVARGGSPDNPRVFHETSLALHVMNTCLIIVILYRLFGRLGPAAAVGLIFGVHPMTVEPIAWVGDRKTTLAAFFALWSMLCYIHYARRPRALTYGLCITAYVLSLMSKPTTTLLPGAMLLMDFWPLLRLSVRSILEKVPFGVVAIISSIITVVSQGRTAAVGLPTEGSTVPMLLGFCHNIIFYPCKMLWPVNLTSLYAKPDPMSLASPILLAMVAGTIVLTAAMLVSLRWTRALLTGWLIFLCIIFPTMGGIGFTVVIASDKYAYLPAIGLLMVLCWLASLGYDRLRDWRGLAAARACVLGTAVLVAAMEFAALRAYVPCWRDTQTLEEYMAAHAPKTSLIHYNLGLTHADKGEWPEAIACFNRSIELDPAYIKAHNNLGVVMIRLNRLAEAEQCFQRALRIDPGFALALDNLGTTYMLQGRYEASFTQFERALQRTPDWGQAHRNYGMALQRAGKQVEAVAHLTRAVELGAADAQAYASLGQALASLGRKEEALSYLRRATELAPDWLYPREQVERLEGRHGSQNATIP